MKSRPPKPTLFIPPKLHMSKINVATIDLFPYSIFIHASIFILRRKKCEWHRNKP